MVFVKVRETYDLHTKTNKISVVGIHTPTSGIIKRNYPGLLMQCRAYRPVSCDVTIACASMLPADPLQVGVAEGDIAPEDLFNPILYKACNNVGMSQIEARIQSYGVTGGSISTIAGETAACDNSTLSNLGDEFNLYYGMLSDTHQWRHANPQSGLTMRSLKPLVYDIMVSNSMNSFDGNNTSPNSLGFTYPNDEGSRTAGPMAFFKGRAHPMPFMNCTSYGSYSSEAGFDPTTTVFPNNHETDVPTPIVYVGCVIVPPSRLHQLFYRMVVEWTLEFSQIRALQEITDWAGLAQIGAAQHFQTYDYSAAKEVAGVTESTMQNDMETVSTNVDINKVM